MSLPSEPRSRRTWLPPYQVGLAVAGILLGLIPGLAHPRLPGDLILAVFVPGLVFEAALNLDLRALRMVAWPVALLATGGVLVSVALVGLACRFALGLDWTSALLLGAILSPTDPIAVVAVMRGSGAPPRLGALLEGESLFNDGTGAAVFAAILAVAATGGLSPRGAGVSLLYLVAVGALVGAAAGMAGGVLVRRSRSAPLEVLLTLLVAYGSYLLASAVGSSGVMAVVVAGVTMARIGIWQQRTERSWRWLALALSVPLFLLIGAGLRGHALAALLGPTAFAFLAMAGSRLLLVNVPGLRVPRPWRSVLWWGGVRGALSVALALAAAGRPGVDARVPLIAYGAVMLSLLIQGTAVRPAVERLRVGMGGES